VRHPVGRANWVAWFPRQPLTGIHCENASVAEYGEQSADAPRGDLEEERRYYHERSQAAADWVLGLPDRVRRNMRTIQTRCPDGGCLLASVYRLPLNGGGERYLVIVTTSAGVQRVGFLNWAWSDDCNGPPVWFPSGCKHGHAKLDRSWFLDCFGLVRGWHHHTVTVEEDRASAPRSTGAALTRRPSTHSRRCGDPSDVGGRR
jgi:hypothetical protein